MEASHRSNLPVKKINILAALVERTIFRKRAFRFLLFLLLALWCFAFSFDSLFNGSIEAAITYPFLKYIFHLVCHQLNEKSFLINGNYLMVCARCTGIYLGAFLTSIVALLYTKRTSLTLRWLYISMIPMLVDVASNTFHIYSYSKIFAFFTGLFFGSTVFIYILSTIENNFTDNLYTK